MRPERTSATRRAPGGRATVRGAGSRRAKSLGDSRQSRRGCRPQAPTHTRPYSTYDAPTLAGRLHRLLLQRWIQQCRRQTAQKRGGQNPTPFSQLHHADDAPLQIPDHRLAVQEFDRLRCAVIELILVLMVEAIVLLHKKLTVFRHCCQPDRQNEAGCNARDTVDRKPRTTSPSSNPLHEISGAGAKT